MKSFRERKRQNRIIVAFSVIVMIGLLSPYFLDMYPEKCHGLNPRKNLYHFTFKEWRDFVGEHDLILANKEFSKQKLNRYFLLSGTLSLEPILNQEDRKTSIWQASLSQIKTQGKSHGSIKKDLLKPFEIAIHEDCSMDKMILSPAISKESQKLLRKMILFSQHSLPLHRGSSWTAHQEDDLGIYQAQFEKNIQRASAVILKNKTALVTNKTEFKELQIKLEKSHGEARFNAYLGIFDKIRMEERITFTDSRGKALIRQYTYLGINPSSEGEILAPPTDVYSLGNKFR